MRGFWSSCSRVILLREGLTVVERRCVLAHELAHVELRHNLRLGADGALLTIVQEEDADLLAARKMIDLAMLAAVADVQDIRVAAELLFVTPAMVETRIRHLHPSERHYLRRAIERYRKESG